MKFLSKLLSPQAALKLAASHLGVDAGLLEAFGSRVQAAVSPVAGSEFQLIPSALAAANGDFSPFRTLYDKVLANPSMRPLVAPIVSKWLEENDKEFIALKMLSVLNKLPLVHMGQDVNNVEAFLEQGLLPLLDTVFTPDPSCHCGSKFTQVAPQLVYCQICDEYKDV